MKKAASLILVLCLSLALCIPALAEVVLSPQNLEVNGTRYDCQKYNIDGNNYFKLRDVAKLLSSTPNCFEVTFSDDIVRITTGRTYTEVGGELETGTDRSSTAQPSKQAIQINGKTRTDLSVYNIGGNNFFKLRDLGEAIGFDVDYDETTDTAKIASRAATSDSDLLAP